MTLSGQSMSAFQRCLVLAAEVAAKTEAAAVEGLSASAKRRGKSFFEVVANLPDWGVGAKLRRGAWSKTEYYEVTKIRIRSHVSGLQGMHWASIFEFWSASHRVHLSGSLAPQEMGSDLLKPTCSFSCCFYDFNHDIHKLPPPAFAFTFVARIQTLALSFVNVSVS